MLKFVGMIAVCAVLAGCGPGFPERSDVPDELLMQYPGATRAEWTEGTKAVWEFGEGGDVTPLRIYGVYVLPKAMSVGELFDWFVAEGDRIGLQQCQTFGSRPSAKLAADGSRQRQITAQCGADDLTGFNSGVVIVAYSPAEVLDRATCITEYDVGVALWPTERDGVLSDDSEQPRGGPYPKCG